MRKVFVAMVTKAGDRELDFILSDNTKDRMGDIISPDGWVLDNFKKNPIALFNHNSSFPIGTWKNIRVKDEKLIARLQLADEGTSERIDELIRLVQQNVLRAVSVGFQPIETEALADNSGILFKEQELLEASLVTVPANPAAVQLARSLVSDQTMELVFGEIATRGKPVVHKTGELAVSSALKRNGKMKSLSERIVDAQASLVQMKDKLTEHLAAVGDEPDEAALSVTEEFTQRIANQQRNLDGLKAAETQLATAVSMDLPTAEHRTGVPALRVPARAKQIIKPSDHVLRSIVAKVIGHATKTDARQVLIERYGEDGNIDPQTKAVFDVVTRAAALPATTTTVNWAIELVQTAISDFMSVLMPASVYPGLSAKGLRLSFGRSGIISIPTRDSSVSLAGAFVLQGDPIPVKQGKFTAQTLGPKKMAVISTFTREIAEHSIPAIEGLIRDAMQEDTSFALDGVLVGTTAATTAAPAGLRVAASTLTATAGGGFTALVGDLKALIGRLITLSNGNLRTPTWIMNPVNALSASITQNAGGDFPFKSEIAGGQFMGYPLIISPTVPVGVVMLVDASDFVSVEGDAPRFDVSDQATLHMEDTLPLPLSATGSPNVVAAPLRSLYQTDSMALRMIMDVNWIMRRPVVAWVAAVTW